VSGAVRFARLLWPAVAEELGFAPGPRGERVRNGSALRSEGDWLALALREPFEGDPLRDLLGSPGLWRALRERPLRDEPSWTRVFDLPPLAPPEAEDEPLPGHPCAALLDWAEATADGSTPRGWTPPQQAEVDSWLEPARRSVRAGAHVAQIDLVVEPPRFGLVIPALVRIPAELPPARVAWLDELCHDTQERWRMVRFGVDEAAASVRAEVDLTGAPLDRARPLVELALAALTCSAEWALPSFSLVTDPGVASQTLDRNPRRAPCRLTKRRGDTR
jgi:hypothetical protein